MLVSELFKQEKIEIEFITENFDTGQSYWNSCDSFITENWLEDIDSLSIKQGAWLTKILDECVELRIKNQ